MAMSGDGPKSAPHRKRPDETELIQVDVEQSATCYQTPERMALDSGVQSQMVPLKKKSLSLNK